MTKFDVVLRNNENDIQTFYDLRHSITVVRTSATDEVTEAYFELLPSGRRFDGLIYKLFVNGKESKFLEYM